MTYRRKTDTNSGEIYKFENIGQELEGVYLGSFDFEGDYGPTKKHLFKVDNKVKVVIGQKHLTDLLEGEKSGQKVIVTYSENKKLAKGRNPMKMYTLDFDDSYKPSDDEVNVAVAQADYDDEPSDDSDDEIPADEVKTEPVKAAPKARPPALDQQARVKALLNRKTA